MKELIIFKNLPLSNGLIDNWDENVELFDLNVGFDEKTSLVQLMSNVPASSLFNETYVYDSSQSNTMKRHFRDAAKYIKDGFSISRPLEIGSNSGIFIEHFDKGSSVAVEPCSNFADRTVNMGIETYPMYWTLSLAEQIVKKHGKRDLVFSANTISHVHNLSETLYAVHEVLQDDGIFVIESPSLVSILQMNAFDQFYHEHQSYFSAISLQNILDVHGFYIFDLDYYDIHGGSYRYYIAKKKSGYEVSDVVYDTYHSEKRFGVEEYDKIMMHIVQMKENINAIKELMLNMKNLNEKIIGYGATAKFTQVVNMSGLDSTYISYVMDTTPEKQGRFVPKAKIPIVKYEKELLNEVKYCFLGAWNYKDEIMQKEKDWINRGGKFITHVPEVHII